MTHCLTCGGAIGEPGKSYLYAGKWCHCAIMPQQIQRPAPPEFYQQMMVQTGTGLSDRDILLNVLKKLDEVLIELKKQ